MLDITLCLPLSATVQVSRLLLSLPAPTTAPMAALPPPPLLPPRPGVGAAATTAPRKWSGAAAVDVSFELPTCSPTLHDPYEHLKMQQPIHVSVGGTVQTPPEAAVAAAPASANRTKALLSTSSALQQQQPSNSSPRASDSGSAAAEQFSGPWFEKSLLEETLRAAAVMAQRHDDRITESARSPSGAVTAVEAATEAAVTGWSFGRVAPFKQPDPAAWGATGAYVEPPSPTFSAMERAASAAAVVAARLFDAEVLPSVAVLCYVSMLLIDNGLFVSDLYLFGPQLHCLLVHDRFKISRVSLGVRYLCRHPLSGASERHLHRAPRAQADNRPCLLVRSWHEPL